MSNNVALALRLNQTVVAIFLLFSSCSASITPTSRHSTKHPGKVGSSLTPKYPEDQPSSPLAADTNPESWGENNVLRQHFGKPKLTGLRIVLGFVAAFL